MGPVASFLFRNLIAHSLVHSASHVRANVRLLNVPRLTLGFYCAAEKRAHFSCDSACGRVHAGRRLLPMAYTRSGRQWKPSSAANRYGRWRSRAALEWINANGPTARESSGHASTEVLMRYDDIRGRCAGRRHRQNHSTHGAPVGRRSPWPRRAIRSFGISHDPPSSSAGAKAGECSPAILPW